MDALKTCSTKLRIGPYCENNKEIGVVFKALQSIQSWCISSGAQGCGKKVFISEKALEEVMERHKVCLWQ